MDEEYWKYLGTVRTLVARGDSDAAMEESLRYVNSADKNLAARANHNCAVFYERKNQSNKLKSYLEHSPLFNTLPEAHLMLMEY